ncbi:cation-translocating P-type ATPase [soil metagenome]
MTPSNETTSTGLQPHELSPEEVVVELASDGENGLRSEQVIQRQIEYGANILRASVRIPAWRRLLAQFIDPQVYLLLSAAVVSIVVWVIEGGAGVPYEVLIILAIVVLNALLGYFQEDRAERALASLQQMVPAQTTVMREGMQRRVMARELVPGDIVLLSEGDSIPADGRLLEAQSLMTSESSLTGESLPVRKETTAVAREAVIGDRLNMVFAGTTAISGNGRAVVTAIGMDTEFGKVAKLLDATAGQITPLQLQLKRLSKQMGVGVVVVAVCVVVVLLLINGVQSANTVMNVLLFGIALAVAATPEGLAAIITLVLAIGVQRMARRGAIVKKLAAAETLGSATVIASDKTGTMTRNEMTVRSIITASGEAVVSGNGYTPEGDLATPEHGDLSADQRNEVHELLVAATLVNNSSLSHSAKGWGIQGDPTEAALLVAAQKIHIVSSDLHLEYPRLAEVVFSSERKMMSTVHEDGSTRGNRVAFTKGAPDILLESCTHEFVAGISRLLTEERRRDILRSNEELTNRALRTLGVAMRSIVPSETINSADPDGAAIEQGLTFLGLIGMMDPPRPEIRVAVEQARRAGIRTILITGDHPGTAMAIARELDISRNDRVLSGMQLERMSDADLVDAVRLTEVYARVKPEHKFRIVRALQKSGEIVAMTGDGVNDAPALKAAHIGIAMGITGTDVAKEAADLILTDDNFSTIVAAVEEGRIVYDNIRKFLRYLLATNLGEVLTIFLSAMILSLRGQGTHSLILPLTAAQILWINLITDGGPALALGVDSAAPDIMQRRPRRTDENIINRQMLVDLLVVAVTMTAGTVTMFFLIADDAAIEYKRSMAFTVLILFQLFNSLSARSDYDSAFRGMFRNGWLWAAILLSVVLQIVLLNVGFLQKAFGVVALNRGDWGLCVVIASSVFWVAEVLKFIRRRVQRSTFGKGTAEALGT